MGALLNDHTHWEFLAYGETVGAVSTDGFMVVFILGVALEDRAKQLEEGSV